MTDVIETIKAIKQALETNHIREPYYVVVSPSAHKAILGVPDDWRFWNDVYIAPRFKMKPEHVWKRSKHG